MNTYCGTLVFSNSGDYEVHSSTGIVNISEILETIYYHPDNNHIYFKLMNNPKTLFEEDGNLYYGKLAPKIYTYHINGENLEVALYGAVGTYVEITIFAEALDEIEYEYKNKKLLL